MSVKGARWRLMRRRMRQRTKRVPVFALLAGLALLFGDWVGFRRFGVWGQRRELSEIWWHLPAYVGASFVVLVLWPWRIDLWDGI
jgi:hypothetical protein